MPKQKVTLDQAREGMVLASPVVDRLGRMLVGAGAAFDARMLLRLRSAGITTVEIEAEGEAAPSVDTAEVEKRIDEVLTRKFRDTADRQAMTVIREAARAHLIERKRIPS